MEKMALGFYNNDSEYRQEFDEVMNTLLYKFYKNRDIQLGNNSEQVNIQKLEYIIKCEKSDSSEFDILTLLSNVVDVLIYLRANSKGSNAYQFMVFYHNELMGWLVTDERYLNHMHAKETVGVEEGE